MKMKVSKIESVTRQLNQAIELFFFDKDIISCLTLAGATRLIVLDLAQHAGSHTGMQSLIKSEMIGEFEKVMRTEQNFFKHAEKDGFADIEFDPKKVEWLLIDVLNIYEQLPGCKLTQQMMAFQFYYIVNNPSVIIETKRDQVLKYLGNDGIPSKKFIWDAIEYGFKNGVL